MSHRDNIWRTIFQQAEKTTWEDIAPRGKPGPVIHELKDGNRFFTELKKGKPILRHDEEFEPILHQAETLTGTAQVKTKRGNKPEKENKTNLVEVKLGEH